jgi:CPA2 family monovalent cation:H+ antiporter-2
MLPLISQFGSSISFICIVVLLVVFASFFLKKINQPNLIAYILIGILVGPSSLDLIENPESIVFIGELGIILLFFFIGMEIDLSSFIRDWKLALFGTLSQILLSVLSVFLVGYFLDWSMSRILVLGCVIALSSSAVVFKLLEERGLFSSKLGKNVSSILLAQDIAIAPILIFISMMGTTVSAGSVSFVDSIYMKILGGIIFVGLITYVAIKKEIKQLPFKNTIKDDHELQVFMALFFCFSGALLANFFGISEALGAFVGGIVMHAGKATAWIHQAIHSFRILFVAIFFISIGAQLNLSFLVAHWHSLALMLIAVYITNHMINALILRAYSNDWKSAIVGGALLGQIGELSFLICMTAINVGILTQFSYDFTISLISLTIFISPIWILITERLVAKT